MTDGAPRRLQSTWKLESGDGTGCSLADARARNLRNKCGFPGCEEPPGDGTFMGFRVCVKHGEESDAYLRHLLCSE